MNVVFTTTSGRTTNMVFNYGTTIDEILKKYLKRVNREDMIGKKEIGFLFYGNNLRFGDKTPIEQKFKGVCNPKVNVLTVSQYFP